MFCSTLRKRQEYASIPDILLSQQQPRWKESSLQGHDLAIPLPKTDHQSEEDLFQLLLISTTDMSAPEQTMERIERLYHQHGGRHVGIVFLLSSDRAGIVAFMNLQASLLSKIEMPILPLTSVTLLPTTLFSFQRQLVAMRSSASTLQVNAVVDLLPFCTTNPPLSEHSRNILSDVCSNIPSLAQAATTGEGQEVLKQWLENTPGVADDVIAFWEQEFIVD